MADRANQSHMTFLIIDETAWLVSWWMFVKLYVLWAQPCQYCPPLKWQIWSRMMKNRSIMCWTSQVFFFFFWTYVEKDSTFAIFFNILLLQIRSNLSKEFFYGQIWNVSHLKRVTGTLLFTVCVFFYHVFCSFYSKQCLMHFLWIECQMPLGLWINAKLL